MLFTQVKISSYYQLMRSRGERTNWLVRGGRHQYYGDGAEKRSQRKDHEARKTRTLLASHLGEHSRRVKTRHAARGMILIAMRRSSTERQSDLRQRIIRPVLAQGVRGCRNEIKLKFHCKKPDCLSSLVLAAT